MSIDRVRIVKNAFKYGGLDVIWIAANKGTIIAMAMSLFRLGLHWIMPKPFCVNRRPIKHKAEIILLAVVQMEPSKKNEMNWQTTGVKKAIWLARQ